ncbi:hypothetical protein BgiMline_025778, partial [Biomphalaria glabrata]
MSTLLLSTTVRPLPSHYAPLPCTLPCGPKTKTWLPLIGPLTKPQERPEGPAVCFSSP